MGVRIITDSASDFSLAEAKELGIDLICLRVSFGEEEYLDGDNLSHELFYDKLVMGKNHPKTSQPSPTEFEKIFEDVKNSGDEALCITISSALSGTIQSANIAAEDYRDMVHIVDSENASLGQRILVFRAIELRKEGKSAGEIAKILETEKKRIKLYALLDTLEYLKKGGRISPAVAAVGAALSIKPIITVEKGKVELLDKTMGVKRGRRLLSDVIVKAGGINFDLPYTLAYSGTSREFLYSYMDDHSQIYDGHVAKDDIPIESIGSAIGTHIGPGAIGVAFFSNQG